MPRFKSSHTTSSRFSRRFRGRLARLFSPGAVLMILCACAGPAHGQITGFPVEMGGGSGGVYIDPDGVVRSRQSDVNKEMEQARAHARSGAAAVKDEKLAFVSLPKLFAEVRALVEAGKPVPAELRYLGGITQLRYVFVYPDSQDLVIAGPAEPWDEANRWEPVGKRTGRPVLQLDDLVAALRTANGSARTQPFGCSIDPAADSLEKSGQVMRDYAGASRAERMEAMGKALGPQKVSVFGTAPDTRLAFVCVAADFKLKRLTLGVEPPAVAGVGNAIDNSRAAGSRVWFEALYEPLLVSPDGNAFEFRGPRLQLKAGALSFDPKGATDKAALFAKQFTAKVPQLAAAVPVFADLQNVTDVALLAILIRQDRLDQRAGWDSSWAVRSKAYSVAPVPVPQSAETLVAYTSGSIAAGGVSLTLTPWADPSARQVDQKNTLAVPMQARAKLRETRKAEPQGRGDGAVLLAP